MGPRAAWLELAPRREAALVDRFSSDSSPESSRGGPAAKRAHPPVRRMGRSVTSRAPQEGGRRGAGEWTSLRSVFSSLQRNDEEPYAIRIAATGRGGAGEHWPALRLSRDA